MKLSPEATDDQCWFATHVHRKSSSRFLEKHPGKDGKDKYFTVVFNWDAGYPILRIRRNGKLALNAAISHEEPARYDRSDLSIQTVILGKLSDLSFVNGLTTTFKVKFDNSISASSFLECYNELSVQKLNKSKEKNCAKKRTKKMPVRPPLVPVKCNNSSQPRPDEDKENLTKVSKEDRTTSLTVNGCLTDLLLATEMLMKGVNDLNDAVKQLKQEIDVTKDGNVDDIVEREDGKDGPDNDDDADDDDDDEDKIFNDIALPNDHFFVDSQNSQDFRTRFLEYK